MYESKFFSHKCVSGSGWGTICRDLYACGSAETIRTMLAPDVFFISMLHSGLKTRCFSLHWRSDVWNPRREVPRHRSPA